MTDLILRARLFATEKHSGMERRFGEGQYIQHPQRIAERAKELWLSHEEQAAAWLHDVVEDCGVQIGEILDRFGYRVADLVWIMSDLQSPSIHGNREKRHAAQMERFRISELDSGAHTLKMLDILDNLPSIRDNDKHFWKTYRRESCEWLECLTSADFRLRSELRELLESSP